MTPSRRSFIRGLAALVVLPKLPVVEAAEELIDLNPIPDGWVNPWRKVAPAATFNPLAYVGEWRSVNISNQPENNEITTENNEITTEPRNVRPTIGEIDPGGSHHAPASQS